MSGSVSHVYGFDLLSQPSDEEACTSRLRSRRDVSLLCPECNVY